MIFYFTAKDETSLLQINDKQYTSINVVGRQWSWTFNYNYDASLDDGQGAATSSTTAYDIGTAGQVPTLWLPDNEEVKFTLTSPDVIHSFWIPNFLFKLDVVPGRVNMFEVTPDKEVVWEYVNPFFGSQRLTSDPSAAVQGEQNNVFRSFRYAASQIPWLK